VVLEEVWIELPWEDRGPVQVRADQGRVDLKTRGFVLEGQVVASTHDGERFETRALRYEPERERLVSDDPVRVSGKRVDVQGAGMEIHVPARRVKLLGPVQATTEPG
jgi:LPS export ABC transporter protein LptC